MLGFGHDSCKRRIRELHEAVEQLHNDYDLLRREWREWRQQLSNAAARLERAETRAQDRAGAPITPTDSSDPPPEHVGVSPSVWARLDPAARARILERRRARGVSNGPR
jgi:hypothetical protein